jgi:hypothetical protein
MLKILGIRQNKFGIPGSRKATCLLKFAFDLEVWFIFGA